MALYDRFDDIVLRQYDQQDAMVGIPPADETERVRIAMELCVGLQAEITGYLRAAGYSTILPDTLGATDRKAHRLVEVVDMLKYVLSLAHLDGLSPDVLYRAFAAKTDVVTQRMQRELQQTRIAGFDIDGVLAHFDYPELGDSWTDEVEATWIASGAPNHCRLIDGAHAFLHWLKAQGYGIVAITARKRHKHPVIEAHTYEWLRACDLPIDRVIFAQDKAQAIRDNRLALRFFVEDSPKHALDIAAEDITVYYIGAQRLEHPNIRWYASLADVADRMMGEQDAKRHAR